MFEGEKTKKIKGSIQKHKETKNKKERPPCLLGRYSIRVKKNNQQQNVANENTKKQRKNKKNKKGNLVCWADILSE